MSLSQLKVAEGEFILKNYVNLRENWCYVNNV